MSLWKAFKKGWRNDEGTGPRITSDFARLSAANELTDAQLEAVTAKIKELYGSPVETGPSEKEIQKAIKDLQKTASELS